MFKRSIEAIRMLEKRYISKPRGIVNVENEVEERLENSGLSDVDYRGISVEAIDLDRVVKITSVYGLDSSSRVIDTPYSFIAVGASTVLNRFTGLTIDYPDVKDIYEEGSRRCFTLLIPEFEASDSELDKLEETNIMTRNPGGFRYRAGYNKSVALDELRLILENAVLGEVLLNDSVKDAVLLLDGPLYVIPHYLHTDSLSSMDGFIEAYVRAWSHVVSKRLDLLRNLFREKNITVIGVVKRINKSDLLARRDPLNVSRGCLNDYTYLSMAVERIKVSISVNPVRIGPLTYRPIGLKINLPVKNTFYIGVPRALYGGSYRSYAFFRVEAFDHLDENEIMNPVLYDSVITGTTMPLTVLIADDRVKRITNCLVNYMKAILELPVETTFDYINLA